MNLRTTLATSAAAAALMAGSAGAQAGDYYVSLFGGLSTFDDEIPFMQSTYNPGITIARHPVLNPTQTDGRFTIVPYTNLYFTLYVGSNSSILVTQDRHIGYYSVRADRSDSTMIHQQSYFQWEDDFDTGFVVGAAFGAEIADGWRSELELAYRQADVSGGGAFHRRINGAITQNVYFPTATAYPHVFFRITGSATPTPYTTGGLPVSYSSKVGTLTAPPQTGVGPINGPTIVLPNAGTTVGNFSSSGDAQVWSLMANLWYDFDFMGLNPEGFHTFVGGGLGVAQLSLDYEASGGTYFGGTIGYALDDSAMGFAYQLGGGIGMELGGGMMLSAQYRWFGTSDVDLGNTDMRVESHNAIIGLQIPLGNLSM